MVLLSKREATIMKDLASGLAAKQIADKNFISVHTAQAHIKSIRRKMNAHSNVHAVVKYLASHGDAVRYLKQLALSVLFLFIQGVSISCNDNADMRNMRRRVRTSRTLKVRVI